jgi:hypothetical protein
MRDTIAESGPTLSPSHNAVVTVVCNEKGESITHNVYPFSVTLDSLERLWNVAKVHPTLFGIAATKDFGKFCEVFIHYNAAGQVEGNGLIWLVDDYTGIFYMTDIYHPDDAMVHFSFFDRRMRGRENLVKEMLKYVFTRYNFRRLSAQVPMFALPKGYRENLQISGKSPTEAGVFGFVKACGFSQEGRKRACVEYKNDYFDVILYGILKEEALG